MCICNNCGTSFLSDVSRVNRAKKIGAPLYCGKSCAGLARRLKNPPTYIEKKELKRIYDSKRRIEKADELRVKKHEYFQRTYDPVKAALDRKKRMPKHVEYCRRPEYKAYKKEYDRKYRAEKEFGEFSESFLLLQDVQQQIDSLATRYEIYQSNDTLNKSQKRRRAL